MRVRGGLLMALPARWCVLVHARAWASTCGGALVKRAGVHACACMFCELSCWGEPKFGVDSVVPLQGAGPGCMGAGQGQPGGAPCGACERRSGEHGGAPPLEHGCPPCLP